MMMPQTTPKKAKPMADIKVTSEELRSVAGNLSAGSGTVTEQLEAMKRQVDTLVSSNWQGAASAAFTDLYTQWNTSAAQLRDALDGISAMLTSSAQAYEDTERGLEQTFRQ